MPLTESVNLVLKNYGNPAVIAGVAPTLDYRFALDRSEIEAVSLTDKLTVTTVDADGTYFGSGGSLERATANSPRFSHNTATGLSEGLLLEQQSTNSLPNNTNAGAITGSPGTNPTGWTTISNLGLTRTLESIGIEDGLSYIDLRYNGTTSSAQNTAVLRFQTATDVPAVSGEQWFGSIYVKLAAGSFAGFTDARLQVREVDNASALLGSTVTSLLSATSASLKSQRFTVSRTLSQATTAYCQLLFSAVIPTSTAVDVTLRFAMPQLEKLTTGGPTSVITTTTAAVTRSADNIKIAAGSGVITGTYTMVEKPAGCATVSGTDILLNTGYTAERVMVFPTSLTEEQKTSIRGLM